MKRRSDAEQRGATARPSQAQICCAAAEHHAASDSNGVVLPCAAERRCGEVMHGDAKQWHGKAAQSLACFAAAKECIEWLRGGTALLCYAKEKLRVALKCEGAA